jgi:hypothetical protein
VFAAFERTAYTVIKGEITKFNSSPGTRRGVLRQVRINIDLRERASADRNAFPCRCI